MAFWRPKITEEMVKKAREGYIKASSIPTLTSAKIEEGFVKTTWSQKSLDLGTKRTFSKLWNLDHLSQPSTLIRNENGESLTRYKNGQTVCISKQKNEKGDDVTMLEIWSNENICQMINLTELDLHGMVYFDNELGGLVLNPSGTKAAFIAEAKKAKNEPFFPVKTTEVKPGTTFGQEFAFREEWGEQLLGRSQSVIVITDLNSGQVEVFQDSVPDKYCPGQLEWINDDLLCGVLVENVPYKLGLIYCSNRPSGLFQLQVSQGQFEILRDSSGLSCKRPKSNGKYLIWLETELLSATYPGPHDQCFRMVSKDFANDRVQTVIDFKHEFDPDKDDFAGLYLLGTVIPNQVFINDNTLVWNICVDGLNTVILIDLEKNSYKVLDFPQTTVLDVQDSNVVAMKSDPKTPGSIWLGQVQGHDNLVLQEICPPMKIEMNQDIIFRKLVHDPQDGSGLKFSSIYVGPANKSLSTCPLIVWPHGGPHSVIPQSFTNDAYYFLDQGFAVLFVNYRGSICQGKKGVESLLGKVGDTDVKDCVQALQECLQAYPNLDKDRVVLFGGSHGGFLVTHLSGQYPDMFKVSDILTYAGAKNKFLSRNYQEFDV